MSYLTNLNTTMSRNSPPIAATGPSDLSLNLLIRYMDNVLSAITKKDVLDSGIKLRDFVQPLSLDLSKLFEGISQGAKRLSDENFLRSKLSTEAQTVALDVLRGVGNAHWAAVGLLVIANVLDRFEKISANDRECIDLLKAMFTLAKYMKQLKDNRFDLHREILEKMSEAVQLIVRGAILCHSFIASNKISKFLLTTKIREELVYVRGKVDSMKSDLVLQMQVLIMSTLTFYISRNLHTGGMDEINFLAVTELPSQQSNDIYGETEQTYITGVSGSESETGSPSIQDNFDEINGHQQPEIAPRTVFLKLVLKVSIKDEKSKRKALKVVAGVSGVDSVAVDLRKRSITVIGDVDPVFVTVKLRKFGFTELLSLGPANEKKREDEEERGKIPELPTVV